MAERDRAAWLAQRRAAILLLSWLVVVAGALAAARLPLALDSAPQAPQWRLYLSAPGVTALTLEQHLTAPLEADAREFLGARTLDSRTYAGRIELHLSFPTRGARDALEARVAAWLARAQQRFAPLITATRSERYPREPAPLEFLVTSESADVAAVRQWVEGTLVRALNDVPGVVRMALRGGPEREADVVLEEQRLAGAGLGPSDVWAALRAAPGSMPIAGLGSLPVRLPGGESVALGEVAQIEQRTRVPVTVELDGRSGVWLAVHLAPQAALAEVAERVRAQLDWLRSNRLLPAELRVHALGEPVRAMRLAVGDALSGAFVAVLLAGLAIAWRASWRVLVRAAFAMLVALALCSTAAALFASAVTPARIAGLGLGATLLLALGAVVLSSEAGVAPGGKRRGAVWWVVIALACVCALLALVEPREGEFLTACAAALGAGALAGRVLWPALARSAARPPPHAARRLRHAHALAAAAAALAAAVLLVATSASGGMQLRDDGRVRLHLLAPAGMAESQQLDAERSAVRAVRADPRVAQVWIERGASEDAAQALAPVLPVTLQFTPVLARGFDARAWQQHAHALAARLHALLAGWSVTLLDAPTDAVLELTGPDANALAALAQQVTPPLAALPGVRAVVPVDAGIVASFQVRADAERLAQAGLSALDVERSVSIAQSGVVAGELRDGEARYRINLRLPQRASTQEQLAGTLLAGERKAHAALRLGGIAEVAPVSAAAVIERRDGQPLRRLAVRLAPQAAWHTVAAQAERVLAEVALAPGYRAQWQAPAGAAVGTNRMLLAVAPAVLLLWAAVVGVACGTARAPACILLPAALVMIPGAGVAGPAAVWLGVVVAGLLGGAVYLVAERGRDDAVAGAAQVLLLPLAAAWAPQALGVTAPLSLGAFAGALAAGCLVAYACAMLPSVSPARSR